MEKELKQRTKQFALDVFKLVDDIPDTVSGSIIANNLANSAAEVASVYRASCRAKNKSEFIPAIELVLEQTDDTALWIDILIGSELLDNNKIQNLKVEVNDLLTLFESLLPA